MKSLVVSTLFFVMSQVVVWGLSGSEKQYSFVLRNAAPLQFPGIVHGGSDPKAAGDVDCNSPAHWDGDTMYIRGDGMSLVLADTLHRSLRRWSIGTVSRSMRYGDRRFTGTLT